MQQQPQRDDEDKKKNHNPLPYAADQQRQNYVPPDVLRHVTSLSDPYRQTGDQYLMSPPAAKPQSLPGRAADTTLAAVSHFAIAFGFFGIGFLLSIAISLFIWLYSKRSPYVEFQSSQAGRYQCFVLVFNVLYVAMLGVLLALGFWNQASWVGLLFLGLVIVGLLWFVFSILYGVWGGILVLMGKDFRYPYFGRDKS